MLIPLLLSLCRQAAVVTELGLLSRRYMLLTVLAWPSFLVQLLLLDVRILAQLATSFEFVFVVSHDDDCSWEAAGGGGSPPVGIVCYIPPGNRLDSPVPGVFCSGWLGRGWRCPSPCYRYPTIAAFLSLSRFPPPLPLHGALRDFRRVVHMTAWFWCWY
jgi:hypothetical protein